MRIFLQFVGMSIVLLFVNSCGTVRRLSVDGASSEKKDHQILVTEYFRASRTEPETATLIPAVEETDKTIQPEQHVVRPSVPHNTSFVPDDDTLAQEPVEDVISTSEMLAEAAESERIARKAVTSSFLPLLIWIFPPLYFVGIILTLSRINRFNRYTYVTEKGLKDIHTAKIILLVSSLLPVAFVLLILLAIYYL